MNDTMERGLRRLRGGRGSTGAQLADLRARVARLEEDVAESRRLNERLSDVLDVVVELLVPATQRDDARLDEALKKLGQTVPQ